GMRLYVRVGAAEQLLGTLDRQLLGDIDVLAAAIVAPAGIALGVLVGKHRASRFEHRPRDDVLRGDQLNLLLLASEFGSYRVVELGVALGEGLLKEGLRCRMPRGIGC